MTSGRDADLRIGLDALPALTHAPGAGRYARELARALAELEGGPTLRLLELGRAPRVLAPESLGAAAGCRVSVPLPARLAPWLAALGLDAGRLCGGVDLFHQVRATGPPCRSAPVTRAVAEWCSPEEEPRLFASLRSAAGLLVFCEEYRRRLIVGGIDAERIHRVPVGAEHWLRELRYELPTPGPERPARILVLGAPRPGRGHLEVLEACERLHAGGVELELVLASSRVEPAHPLAARVAASPLGSRVSWTAPLERALPRLVASCRLLVHLSADEGTPVTPAEGVALGLACLLDRRPAFVEALGEVPTWRQEGAPLEEDLLRALARPPSEEARRELLQRLSWRRSAEAHITAWRAFLERIAA